MLSKKLALSYVALVALVAACEEDKINTSEPCSDGDVLCEGNALAVCDKGSWKIEICKDEKPICDVDSQSCLEDENACHPSKCSLVQHAVKMGCNDDEACIVSLCENGYGASSDKSECVDCGFCEPVKHASVEPSPVDCSCVVTCEEGYVVSKDGKSCQSSLDCSDKIPNGTGKVDDELNICVVDKCSEKYEPSEDGKECIFAQNPCTISDGNVPTSIEHGTKGCDGNDLKTCKNGVLADDNVEKCADNNKVCRFDTTNQQFGCYKALQNTTCNTENYLQACEMENIDKIIGCRSNGVCAYTCLSGMIDTGTQCILPAHCSTTAVSLTGALNTVAASGIASVNDQISQANLYCTNNLDIVGRNWKSATMSPDAVSNTEGKTLLSVTAAVLAEGKNYCVIGVMTDDSRYFFCPVGQSESQQAIYSSNSTRLTEDQVVIVENTCGNGVLDAGEECDTNDFGGKTCASVKQNDKMLGNLSCKLCAIDASGCSEDYVSVGSRLFSFVPDAGCSAVVANSNNQGIAANGCSVDESEKNYTIRYTNGYVLEFSSNAKIKTSGITLFNTNQYVTISGLPKGAVVQFELSSATEGNELQISDNGNVIKSAKWTLDPSSSDHSVKSFALSADATEVKLVPTASGSSKKVFVYKIEAYNPAQ